MKVIYSNSCVLKLNSKLRALAEFNDYHSGYISEISLESEHILSSVLRLNVYSSVGYEKIYSAAVKEWFKEFLSAVKQKSVDVANKLIASAVECAKALADFSLESLTQVSNFASIVLTAADVIGLSGLDIWTLFDALAPGAGHTLKILFEAIAVIGALASNTSEVIKVCKELEIARENNDEEAINKLKSEYLKYGIATFLAVSLGLFAIFEIRVPGVPKRIQDIPGFPYISDEVFIAIWNKIRSVGLLGMIKDLRKKFPQVMRELIVKNASHQSEIFKMYYSDNLESDIEEIEDNTDNKPIDTDKDKKLATAAKKDFATTIKILNKAESVFGEAAKTLALAVASKN